uniref:Protoheme IX farnesyltransferase, mitochondrial n=1 Tax=Plectus sambesii TaxID=2011161 RepID=A0A914WGB1_9BILA
MLMMRNFCGGCGRKITGVNNMLLRSAASMPKTKPNYDEMPSTSDYNAARRKAAPPVAVGIKLGAPAIHKQEKPIAALRSDEWTVATSSASPGNYLQLSKARLSALVTVTAIGGFAMAPGLFVLPAFASCAVGTALMSACANSYNQFLESPYDSQMKRTQARVLVVDKISPLHAAIFGTTAGLAGFMLLWVGANPLTATLGLANVLLYAGVYTPMKRHSVACTWAGALVGAIPPLMGYAACCGTLDAGAFVLAGLLYAWQFPHFNGLSWNLRADYSRAGYRVMCVTDQELCRRTTLRHAVALVGLCSVAAPLSDLTTWTFAVDSLPFNAYMVYLSYKFYKQPDAKTSRTLFRYSLIYLPAIMLLMVVSSYGRTPPKDGARPVKEAEHVEHIS